MTTDKRDKLFLRAMRGEKTEVPPLWLMRQAGRYLPEYREVRSQANGFLDLCYTPDMAVEVTLQPIRRYGFDAAILFSDILVVAHALGQPVRFEEGRGPLLEPPIRDLDAVKRLQLDAVNDRLAPVFETVTRLSRELPAETALIGFAGAPWTVATYMVEGGSSKDFATVKTWAFGDPGAFDSLIDLLTEATASYLIEQVRAGAEVVQIFDSWAGALPQVHLERWSLKPIIRIAQAVKGAFPEVPVIAFPKGAGPAYTHYAAVPEIDAVGMDTGLPVDWAAQALQPHVTVQGNLDPMVLVAGGETLVSEVARLRQTLQDGPFVFNLGHGIVPQTPPEHVDRLCALVRQGR